MPKLRRETILVSLATCLLLAPIACLTRGRLAAPSRLPVPSLTPPASPRSSFETKLAQAGEWRQRARAEVESRREELEAWDPRAGDLERPDSTANEPWRLQQLAADREGYLHRAQASARHAATLAQTDRERYRAAALRAAIEHELGLHERELQQARILVALQPWSEISLLALRRAALCNGRQSLAVRVEKQLAAVRRSYPTRSHR